MKKRYNRLNDICKNLSEEAFQAYAGQRDYKKALEVYLLLSESLGVPEEIQKYSKNMLNRLGKKIKDTKRK